MKKFPIASAIAISTAVLQAVPASATNLQTVPVQTYFVPLPERDLIRTLKNVNDQVDGDVVTLISIAVARNNTIIWYDHWEDAYETDVTNPSQNSTLVIGDGDVSNGALPGVLQDDQDFLYSGESIILENTVPVTGDNNDVKFDARDKIQTSFPVAVTRGAYPESPGSLFAGAVEVHDTDSWGTIFEVPVGPTTETSPVSTSAFELTEIYIIAEDDNTNITLSDGSSLLLNQGQSNTISANQGDVIRSTRPIQADMLVGDKNTKWELRWYSLLPREDWSSTYYTPVGTADKGETVAWLYNPNESDMTVTSNIGGPYTIPPKATIRSDPVPEDSGAEFVSNMDFFGLVQVDADWNPDGESGQEFDWGHPLIPSNKLTSQALIGLGYGCTSNDCKGDTSKSVVFVMPVDNARVCVDFDNDGYTEPRDVRYSLEALQGQRISDDGIGGDNDMSGALIYGTSDGSCENPGTPVDIAVAWGQDPSTVVDRNDQFISLDLGTVVVPFPEIEASKSVLLRDAAGDGEVNTGDTLEYTILIQNTGKTIISAGVFLVRDALPVGTSYVAGTTTYDSGSGSVSIDDDANGSSFPLDGAGLALQARLAPDTPHRISFDVVVKSIYELESGTTEIINEGDVYPNGDPDSPEDTFRTVTPLVFHPSITINNTVTMGPSGECRLAVDHLQVPPNADVTYCLTITNDGDTFLSTVSIANDVLEVRGAQYDGEVPTISTILAPGQKITLFLDNNIELESFLNNSAVVKAVPSYADGQSIVGVDSVTDEDPSSVEIATAAPTENPTEQPSEAPSSAPSAFPSWLPSATPSLAPSAIPSSSPSRSPSSEPSETPSSAPSGLPSAKPSTTPSSAPSGNPSSMPSVAPSERPSSVPSRRPSSTPSERPSLSPSEQPSDAPSGQPSSMPSYEPSSMPSDEPSSMPSERPSTKPSDEPSSMPTDEPSSTPSGEPSSMPSDEPSSTPSEQPSSLPSYEPSPLPSEQPSSVPFEQPSSMPSKEPSFMPSDQPTSMPSDWPSSVPSIQPSPTPSKKPSSMPSGFPSPLPSEQPSSIPSQQPSPVPFEQPSSAPSDHPSPNPSQQPSSMPSDIPSPLPSEEPSSIPSQIPSYVPSESPSFMPSGVPSPAPSQWPSLMATSDLPTSDVPSSLPSVLPSFIPSPDPTPNPTMSSAAVQIVNTIVPLKNGGDECPGRDRVVGDVGTNLTYCFVITNIGDTILTNIRVGNPVLEALGGTINGTINGTIPNTLVPGASFTLFLEDVLTSDLINNATVTATPASTDRTVQLPEVSDIDDSEVQVLQTDTPQPSLAPTHRPTCPYPDVNVENTVYDGHDSGLSCPGNELVTDVAGASVTYCFVVTNNGGLPLTNITLGNIELLQRLNGELKGDIPEVLLPEQSFTVYIEDTLIEDLTNTATVMANPINIDGTLPPPHFREVTDFDTSRVEVLNREPSMAPTHRPTCPYPNVNVENTVYDGHDSGVSCPGNEVITDVAGTSVTYCFVVTNNGLFPLTNIVLGNVELLERLDGELKGDIPEVLSPEQSFTVYIEDTLVEDLTNTATVMANPTNIDGTLPPPRFSEVTDFDTSSVEVRNGPFTTTQPKTCEIDVDVTCNVAVFSPALRIATTQVCKRRPTAIVFKYVGGGCDQNTQDQDGAFECKDHMNGPPPASGSANITVANRNGTEVYFSETVNVGDSFEVYGPGGRRFGGYTSVKIEVDGKTSQSFTFHTSCDDDLYLNDLFGALQVVGYTNREQGTISATSSDSGVETIPCHEFQAPESLSCHERPTEMSFKYVGGGCDETTNHQYGRLSCVDDNGGAPKDGVVNIEVMSTTLGSRSSDKITTYFKGNVNVGETFHLDIRSRFGVSGRLQFIVREENSDNILQDLTLQASCSKPLAVFDQFGSIQLVSYANDSQGFVAGEIATIYTYTVKNVTDTSEIEDLVVDQDGTRSSFDTNDGFLGSNGFVVSEPRKVALSEQSFVSRTTATVTGIVANNKCNATTNLEVPFPPLPTKPVKEGICEGRPREMSFTYLGGDCDQTTNTQFGTFSCNTNSVPTANRATIVVTNKDETITYFSGRVEVGETFDLETNGERMESNVRIVVSVNNEVVQTLMIHTSCSKDLFVGDIFGSMQLYSFENLVQGKVTMTPGSS